MLVDQFLEDATEVDVDCITDGETAVIGAIMEHIEEAGIHTGDSACVDPALFALAQQCSNEIAEATKAMARELKVRGLMNVQFAVKDDERLCARSQPARLPHRAVRQQGHRRAAGQARRQDHGRQDARELGFTEEIMPTHYSVKEAVFPFIRFPGVDIIFGPEMKSTGEVMGIDADLGLAYAKAQMAAHGRLPRAGNIFISVKDADKPNVIAVARDFADLGFRFSPPAAPPPR